MAKGRKGRPRKADARRRATARAGRAPPIDLGTDEMRRLRQILNPGQPGLPADPLSALLSRGFIDEQSYRAGGYFSALVAIARGGWSLRDASVAYLYRRMVAGILDEGAAPVPIAANGHDTSAADHARKRLAAMRAEFAAAGRGQQHPFGDYPPCRRRERTPWLKRFLACGTGNGNGPMPGDFRALGDLREGLHRLAEVKPSYRTSVSPDRMAAE